MISAWHQNFGNAYFGIIFVAYKLKSEFNISKVIWKYWAPNDIVICDTGSIVTLKCVTIENSSSSRGRLPATGRHHRKFLEFLLCACVVGHRIAHACAIFSSVVDFRWSCFFSVFDCNFLFLLPNFVLKTATATFSGWGGRLRLRQKTSSACRRRRLLSFDRSRVEARDDPPRGSRPCQPAVSEQFAGYPPGDPEIRKRPPEHLRHIRSNRSDPRPTDTTADTRTRSLYRRCVLPIYRLTSLL